MHKMPAPFTPDWCLHPGTTLAETLKVRQVSLGAFAEASGISLELLRQLLACDPEARITDDVAQRLHDGLVACGGRAVSADFWVRLEVDYRDGLAKGRQDVSHG